MGVKMVMGRAAGRRSRQWLQKFILETPLVLQVVQAKWMLLEATVTIVHGPISAYTLIGPCHGWGRCWVIALKGRQELGCTTWCLAPILTTDMAMHELQYILH